MWLIKMAWKNMWRNRSRTSITIAAIFFAVILSVLTSSLKDGIFNNLVKNIVGFYSGYVQVHKQGYWNEQILDNSFTATTEIERSILSDRNISSLTPRLESFALVSSGETTRGALVVGINPQTENRVTSLAKKLVSGQYLYNADTAVLLAAGLARRLLLQTGDTIMLIGQGYHGATAAGKYRISGLLHFGSPELNDKVVFMPLPAAQDLYSAPGMITSYILSVDQTGDKAIHSVATRLQSALGDGYEVMSWDAIMPEIKQHIETDTNNMKYIQGILYMLVCFGIFGTLLMMMVERSHEMGMLVAIGMKKTKLAMLLLAESVLTVLGGCLLGLAASIPIVYLLNRHPIKIGGEAAKAYERFGFEAVFPASTEASNFLYQGMVVLVIGLALSVYPMYKVFRLDPVTAMKQ